MTNPDELERPARAAIAVHGAEWVEFFNEWEETSGAFGRAANPATILDLLAANRKMREALLKCEALVQPLLSHGEDRIWRAAKAVEDAARSALTTQRDGE